MPIFSAGARHMIEQGINALPDLHDRDVWRAWSMENPDNKMPNDGQEEVEYIPPAVTSIILSALERVSTSLKLRQDAPDAPEDEVCDLDNDLSFISAIEKSIYARLSAGR